MKTKMILLVDPPAGWKYGFPCEMPEDMDLESLLKKKGYPEKDIEFAKKHTRMWLEEIVD